MRPSREARPGKKASSRTSSAGGREREPSGRGSRRASSPAPALAGRPRRAVCARLLLGRHGRVFQKPARYPSVKIGVLRAVVLWWANRIGDLSAVPEPLSDPAEFAGPEPAVKRGDVLGVGA